MVVVTVVRARGLATSMAEAYLGSRGEARDLHAAAPAIPPDTGLRGCQSAPMLHVQQEELDAAKAPQTDPAAR